MQFLSDEHSRRFGDDYVKEIIRELKSMGKDASGKLAKSIDYRLSNDASEIEFLFEAENYYNFVDKGRRPGSYPPIQAISNWAGIRGINKDAAFAIATSIYKFGIKPTNITRKVENKVLNGKLFNDLENYFQEDIGDKIVEEINKLKK